MKLKIEWEEFVALALENLESVHPTLKKDTFAPKKRYSYKPDGDPYEMPDYIEVEVEQ